jgi:hypothetical protein
VPVFALKRSKVTRALQLSNCGTKIPHQQVVAASPYHAPSSYPNLDPPTMSASLITRSQEMVPLVRSQFIGLYRSHRLTLFGRSAVLIGCELVANAICWVIAGILFGARKETQSIMALSLLAWVGPAPLSMTERMFETHFIQDDWPKTW